MSHKVHPAAKNIVSILESSEGFKQLTGGSGFSGKLRASLKGQKVYQPGQDDSGFGGRPRMTLGSDFGTIKLDSNSYAKVTSGTSRAKKRVAHHHATSRRPHPLFARGHHPIAPKAPADPVEKYSSRKIHAQAVAKAHKAHRKGTLSPSLTLFYVSGPGALNLRPQYGHNFKNRREAYAALKHGEISMRSMVQFAKGKGANVFAPASSLALYLRPANG
ncbi:MAG: hypothetical protein K8R69_06465 [Deltaproteobacteria bacterium]|nr:hypothetical protein [Deltaproteobacteria bacterium]